MQDIESFIFVNMSRFKRLNERKFERLMKKYDLRKIDIEIIIFLSNSDDRDTAKDIAATEMFTKGHISQSVRRMRDKGYLDSIQDEDDLRVQHLRLTDKASAILDEMMSVRKEIECCVFEGISDEDKNTLMRIFDRIYVNILNTVEE